MFLNTRLAFATLAVAGLLAAAAPVGAQDVQTQTQIVKIKDLDLHTAAGQAALRLRVQTAVRNVCGPAEHLFSTGYASYSTCLRDAQTKATHRVDALIASATTAQRVAMN